MLENIEPALASDLDGVAVVDAVGADLLSDRALDGLFHVPPGMRLTQKVPARPHRVDHVEGQRLLV